MREITECHTMSSSWRDLLCASLLQVFSCGGGRETEEHASEHELIPGHG